MQLLSENMQASLRNS